MSAVVDVEMIPSPDGFTMQLTTEDGAHQQFGAPILSPFEAVIVLSWLKGSLPTLTSGDLELEHD